MAKDYNIICLREHEELNPAAAKWFSEKWAVSEVTKKNEKPAKEIGEAKETKEEPETPQKKKIKKLVRKAEDDASAEEPEK